MKVTLASNELKTWKVKIKQSMTIFIQAHKKNRYNYQKIDIITNESDIDDVFQSIYTIIITNMKNF